MGLFVWDQAAPGYFAELAEYAPGIGQPAALFAAAPFPDAGGTGLIIGRANIDTGTAGRLAIFGSPIRDPLVVSDEIESGINTFGYALAGPGNLDDDELLDYAVGAPVYGSGGHVVLLRAKDWGEGNATYSGSEIGAVRAPDTTNNLGGHVAMGDLTADGLDDVVVTTAGDSDDASSTRMMGAFVLEGDATASWPGNFDSDDLHQTGNQTCTPEFWPGTLPVTPRLQDYDGDGTVDAAFGALCDSGDTEDSGVVYFWSGPELAGATAPLSETTLRIVGDYHDHLGVSLAFGDFDGDGTTDLVVGGGDNSEVEDPDQSGSPSGYAAIFYGPLVDGTYSASDGMYALVDAGAKITPQGAGANVSSSMIALDFDGDGASDVALTNKNDGDAYVFLGGLAEK
jgi:hypothetical protein